MADARLARITPSSSPSGKISQRVTPNASGGVALSAGSGSVVRSGRSGRPSSAHGSTASRSSPFHERLYAQAQSLRSKKAKALEDASRELTFTPRINKVSRRRSGGAGASPSSAAAGDRLYTAAVQQRQKLVEQREASHKATTPSFRPEITPKAKKLARPSTAGAGGTSDTFTRLYEHAGKILSDRVTRGDEEIARTCTFKPEVNIGRKSTSRAAAADSKTSPSTAFERLYQPERVASRNSAAHNLGGESIHLEEAKIGKLATAAGHKAGGRGSKTASSSPEAAGARLHAQWTERQQKLAAERAAKEEAEVAGLTFRPQLSVWSKRWASASAGGGEDSGRAVGGLTSTPVHERLHQLAASKQAELAEAALAKAEDELIGCTFRPTVSAVSSELLEEARREDAEAGVTRGDAFVRLYQDGLVRQQQRALQRFNREGEGIVADTITPRQTVSTSFHATQREASAPPHASSSATWMTVGRESEEDVPVHERLYQAARVRQAALNLQEAELSAPPGVHPRRSPRLSPPATGLSGQRADAPAPRHLSLGRMTPPGESVYDMELTSASRRVSEAMSQPADDGVAEALRDAEALLDATRGVEDQVSSETALVAEWTSQAKINDAEHEGYAGETVANDVDNDHVEEEDADEDEDDIPLPTEPHPEDADAVNVAGGLYLL